MSDERQTRDPWAEAQACQQATNVAMGRPLLGYPLGYGYPSLTPEAQARMTCLQMALYVADGAPPLPVGEVIERARAYWRFVQTGE